MSVSVRHLKTSLITEVELLWLQHTSLLLTSVKDTIFFQKFLKDLETSLVHQALTNPVKLFLSSFAYRWLKIDPVMSNTVKLVVLSK
jgi:hypothetical protein